MRRLDELASFKRGAVASQLNDIKTATGFAGLSAMVSDLEAVLEAAPEAAPEALPLPPSAPPSSPPPVNPENNAGLAVPSQSRTTTSSQLMLITLLCTAGIVCFIWLLYEIGQIMNQPSAHVTPPPKEAPAPSRPFPLAPRTDDAKRLPEELPPVGTNHVLTSAQIRYCLAEHIRLGAAQNIIHDTDVAADVIRFNDMIDDYNRRCGEYRYRRGALETAKGEVERDRSALELEGMSRFSTRKTDTRSPTQPTTPPPTTASVAALQAAPRGAHRSDDATSEPQRVDTASVEEHSTPPALSTASPIPREPSQSVAIDAGKVTTDSLPSFPPNMTEKDPVANLEQCLDGRYPALCNHALLTESQVEEVRVAERIANLKQCLTGQYPFCNHSLLTPAQAVEVEQAERQATFEICLEGRYPMLCNQNLLTAEQRETLRQARLAAQTRLRENGDHRGP